MNIILDENLEDDDVVAALHWWPGGVKYLRDFGVHNGTKDPDLLAKLAGERDFILLTKNTKDFFRRMDAPTNGCVIGLDVRTDDIATNIGVLRRAMRKQPLNSAAGRRGKNFRLIHNKGYWHSRRSEQEDPDNVVEF